MTIKNLDGEKVAVSPEELKRMANDAMAEYDAGIRAGGEPDYPQWAADILANAKPAPLDGMPGYFEAKL